MTISQPLFTVGDIVQVDNRENAYITNIRGENGDLFFNVRFIVDKTEQKNVVQARCRVVLTHEIKSLLITADPELSVTSLPRRSPFPFHQLYPQLSNLKDRLCFKFYKTQ